MRLGWSIRPFRWALAILLLNSPALAEALRGRAVWDALSLERQQGYVFGSIDMMNSFSGDKYLEAQSNGIRVCLTGLHLMPNEIIKLIDAYYHEHPEAKVYTAALVITLALTEICSSEINEQRRDLGLELLPR